MLDVSVLSVANENHRLPCWDMAISSTVLILGGHDRSTVFGKVRCMLELLQYSGILTVSCVCAALSRLIIVYNDFWLATTRGYRLFSLPRTLVNTLEFVTT